MIKIILHNLNDDTFVVTNSKSNRLVVKDNKLYVHIKHGVFIEGVELIQEFDTTIKCKEVYEKINQFITERKNIKETINITLKDIKDQKYIDQKKLLIEFLSIMELKFLEYEELYIKDVV